MLTRKTILPLILVCTFGVVSAFSAPQAPQSTARGPVSNATSKSVDAGKKPAVKAHTLEGSVVSMTNDSLTVRSGKKDMSFALNSTTQKPSTLTPGSNVKITYHDEGTRHIASEIQAMAPKSSLAAKQPARK